VNIKLQTYINSKCSELGIGAIPLKKVIGLLQTHEVSDNEYIALLNCLAHGFSP
jgi:hypothetical protein